MGLLGHALARVAKAESFPALVSQRILRPLGMTMTAYGRPPVLSDWMTKGHNRKGAVVPYWDMAVLSGAGGLNSSVADMLTYLDANGGKPGSPIEHAMRDAHKRQRPGPMENYHYGLAWTSRDRGGQTILSHSGGTGGYGSYIAFSPERQAGVVLLTNSGGFEDISDLALALLSPEAERE